MMRDTGFIVSVTLSAFSIGAASSFAASLVILALSHIDDIHYLLTSRRRYKHLEGDWHQYHLTTDSRRRPATFWSGHDEYLSVTCFGRVRGRSRGQHNSNFTYNITGNIRENVMRLCLRNTDAGELPVSITYFGLLSRDKLVGVWVGHDYDERMSASPIILSRTPCLVAELEVLARDARLLGARRHTSRVRGPRQERKALQLET
jgi:hypothetical protein